MRKCNCKAKPSSESALRIKSLPSALAPAEELVRHTAATPALLPWNEEPAASFLFRDSWCFTGADKASHWRLVVGCSRLNGQIMSWQWSFFIPPVCKLHRLVCSGSRGQPGEDDQGGGCGGGHVCVAGPGLCHDPGLHHQPRVRRVAAPAGQDHQVAPPRPQVDHHGHRPLHHPLHHHSYRQVRSRLAPRPGGGRLGAGLTDLTGSWWVTRLWVSAAATAQLSRRTVPTARLTRCSGVIDPLRAQRHAEIERNFITNRGFEASIRSGSQTAAPPEKHNFKILQT